LDSYSVTLYGFFFNDFFSKIIFVNFIWLILNWLKIITIAFLTKYCGLLQCFLIWFSFLCFFFVLIFLCCFFYDFSQNCLYWFYFLNIELFKNLVLYFFSLKYCELLQCFPTWFSFSKLSFNFFFYGLLQCFPTWFFFVLFFIFNFFKYYIFSLFLIFFLFIIYVCIFFLFINRKPKLYSKKLNHVGKELSSQNIVDYYNSFYSVSLFGATILFDSFTHI